MTLLTEAKMPSLKDKILGRAAAEPVVPETKKIIEEETKEKEIKKEKNKGRSK